MHKHVETSTQALPIKAVVTGMGCICAAGNSPSKAFAALLAGQRTLAAATVLGESAMPYPFFAAESGDAHIFAEGRRFSAQDTLTLARFAVDQALESANLPPQLLVHMPIIAGTTAGSALHFLHAYAKSRDTEAQTAPPIAPYTQQDEHSHFSDKDDYLHSNLATALVPQSDGARITLANACTSGADALGMGLDALRLGAQCVLCGGADALSVVPHTGFARLMIYDSEPCRPFDVTRKGLNLGEGAAFVVLEPYELAVQRGAEILGCVLGYGSAADAHHFTAPHPQGRGLRRAIEQALSEAQCSEQDLAFINAHGTATPENDKVEGAVLRSLVQEHGIALWASKGGTGHTLGAAGALEAVLSLEALRQKTVPTSWGFSDVDPVMDVCPTTQTLPIQGSCALSTSLGFGGGNAALVLGSAQCLEQEGACHDSMA